MCFFFSDRRHAGRALAWALGGLTGRRDVVVLALSSAGVPVAHEVARSLGAPLDVVVVRRITVPGCDELTIGAVASAGVVMLNREVIEDFCVSERQILEGARAANQELRRCELAYRGRVAPMDVAGKIVVLIDDGVATGWSMRAAILALRPRNPTQVIAAVPVAPADSWSGISADADEAICSIIPEPFFAVSLCYEDFPETTDDEVRELLRANPPTPEGHVATRTQAIDRRGCNGLVRA